MDSRAVRQIFVGVCIVAASLCLPWLLGLDESGSDLSGLDLRWTTRSVIGGVVAIAVAALLHQRSGAAQPWMAVAAACFGIAFGAGILAVLVEAVTAVVPSRGLPAAWRRYVLGAGVGPGVYLCMLGAGIAGAGALGGRGVFVPRGARPEVRRSAIIGWALVAISLTTMVVARYQVWLQTGLGGSSSDLTGWSLPWLGPASYLASVCVALALAATWISRRPLGLYVAIALGWCWSFITLVVISSGEILGDLASKARVPEELGVGIGGAMGERLRTSSGIPGAELSLSPGPGLTVAHLGSLGLLVGCALLLWDGPGSWRRSP